MIIMDNPNRSNLLIKTLSIGLQALNGTHLKHRSSTPHHRSANTPQCPSPSLTRARGNELGKQLLHHHIAETACRITAARGLRVGELTMPIS